MGTANSLTVELGSDAQRDRRKRILDATIALASQGGFDAVQMRSVAEQADVALGTLYRYFPSKIHLLVSALGREFERAEADTRDKPIPGDTAHERVMFLLDRTTEGLRGPEPHRGATRAFMFADASVKTEILTVGMLLTTMLTRAMTRTRARRAHRGRRGDPQDRRRVALRADGLGDRADRRRDVAGGWTSRSACSARLTPRRGVRPAAVVPAATWWDRTSPPPRGLIPTHPSMRRSWCDRDPPVKVGAVLTSTVVGLPSGIVQNGCCFSTRKV